MNGKRKTLGIALAVLLLGAWIAGCSLQPAPAGATGDVPFRLIVEPYSISGLPGLHSVAEAVYGGKNPKLVIVSGRTNGLHEFLPQRQAGSIWSFPPEKANDKVYVVDLEFGRVSGSKSVDALPSPIARQLKATNTQSFAKNGWLYIVGGYGLTEDGKSMRTFEQVVAIDVLPLIQTVESRDGKLDEKFAKEHIRVGTHPALAVTGGGIAQLGDKTLLVMGQMFNGLYTTDGAVAQQVYSQAVRVLELSFEGTDGIKVKYVGKCPDPPMDEPQPTPDEPYHRRDFTLAEVLTPDGSPRIGVFGGVFKGGRMEGYVNPVYITADDASPCVDKGPKLGFTLAPDATSEQLLSQYEAAVIPIYSFKRKTMYTTFFGGISQYYWDGGPKLKRDREDFSKEPPVDGLPFINSISTLRVGGEGNGNFLHKGERFPPLNQEPSCLDSSSRRVAAPYLGTNSWFVRANRTSDRFGVLTLDEASSPTVIGYLFGGIASKLPYPGKDTCASDMVYKVTLDPTRATDTVRLVPPP